MNFEQQFKKIDNVLWKDAGVDTAIDFVEQTSWILFLKYISDLEKNRKIKAELNGEEYKEIFEEKFRFDVWATPRNEKGEIDYNKRRVNDDLINFVDNELFPYLKSFKDSSKDVNSVEYKIGEIFGQLKQRIESGKVLADTLDIIADMEFTTSEAKHEMSVLYEDRLNQMGNAGRTGGSYYTPRPLIRTMVKVIEPKIEEKVYDGAVGSAGFLVEAFEFMKKSKENLSPKDINTLQKDTFFGKELKTLPFIVGTMNMILHGIESPNIVRANTLSENVLDMQEKDRVDVILANPPFGAKVVEENKKNFAIETGASELLFMQHFMAKLKVGGRAGVVIKNTFLSNTDSATAGVRKKLLEKNNLHTILDLPSGVFQGAGVKTVVLFFKKGEPTEKIWYYQLNPGRNLGKTNALNEKDLEEFLKLQKEKKESENSWIVDVKDLDQETFDLSVKNPNAPEEEALRGPEEILEEIEKLSEEEKEVLKLIKDII